MKNSILSLTTTAMLILSSFASFASTNESPLKNAKTENILDYYVKSTLKGELTYVDYLFSEDFEQFNAHESKGKKINRKELVNYLKKLNGIKMNCKTDYKFIEQSKSFGIAKITMNFENFTRVDYITFNHTEDGWKISKVIVSYS